MPLIAYIIILFVSVTLLQLYQLQTSDFCDPVASMAVLWFNWNAKLKKGKVFPYLTLSIGPGADPSVQAVSLQVTVSHPPGGRLPLLSARPAVTTSRRASPTFGRYQVILLGDRGT